mmetsp:Transcript_21213/g.47369  ORF Transcript_21213/g.47369 Transcript_21213/m.47369 type:complete len:168 (-) Transcript_21213:307-810(-)
MTRINNVPLKSSYMAQSRVEASTDLEIHQSESGYDALNGWGGLAHGYKSGTRRTRGHLNIVGAVALNTLLVQPATFQNRHDTKDDRKNDAEEHEPEALVGNEDAHLSVPAVDGVLELSIVGGDDPLRGHDEGNETELGVQEDGNDEGSFAYLLGEDVGAVDEDTDKH